MPSQMTLPDAGHSRRVSLRFERRRNDRHHSPQFQKCRRKRYVEEGLLGIVPLVGQYVLASTGDQFLRLGDVVLLPAGQDESQAGCRKPSTLT